MIYDSIVINFDDFRKKKKTSKTKNLNANFKCISNACEIDAYNNYGSKNWGMKWLKSVKQTLERLARKKCRRLIHLSTQNIHRSTLFVNWSTKKVNNVYVDALGFFIIFKQLESLVAINKFTKNQDNGLAFSCFQYSGNNKNEHNTKRTKSKKKKCYLDFISMSKSVWNKIKMVCFVIFVTANAHIQIYQWAIWKKKNCIQNAPTVTLSY